MITFFLKNKTTVQLFIIVFIIIVENFSYTFAAGTQLGNGDCLYTASLDKTSYLLGDSMIFSASLKAIGPDVVSCEIVLSKPSYIVMTVAPSSDHFATYTFTVADTGVTLAGSYTLPFTIKETSGYGIGAFTTDSSDQVAFSVVSPPTVEIHFSLLDKIKIFVLDTLISKVFAGNK